MNTHSSALEHTPSIAFYAPAEFLWFGLKFTLSDDSLPFNRRNVLSLSELPARVNKSKERLLKPGRIDAELALAKWCERPLGWGEGKHHG